MEDVAALRRLVETLSLFFTENRAVEEELAFSFTSEFLRNMQDIMFTKQTLAFSRWQNFFNASCHRMLCSPALFIRYVIYACFEDTAGGLHAVERLLDTFAIILRISLETLHRTEVDFRKVVPDIFLVLYEAKLKRSFRKCGGIRRLIKYVNNSKYLESSCIVRDISTFYDFSAYDFGISMNSGLGALILEGGEKLQKTPDFGDVERDEEISFLVGKVLEITRMNFLPQLNEKPLLDLQIARKKFYDEMARITEKNKKTGALKETLEQCPTLNFEALCKTFTEVKGTTKQHVEAMKRLTLPSDLIKRQFKSGKEGMISKDEGDGITETDAKLETLNAVSSFNSDSITNFTAERLEDNTWYENIIEAVIRHNRTESSGQVKSASRIQTEADGILNRLKNTIKSLIEVLDEYDKE